MKQLASVTTKVTSWIGSKISKNTKRWSQNSQFYLVIWSLTAGSPHFNVVTAAAQIFWQPCSSSPHPIYKILAALHRSLLQTHCLFERMYMYGHYCCYWNSLDSDLKWLVWAGMCFTCVLHTCNHDTVPMAHTSCWNIWRICKKKRHLKWRKRNGFCWFWYAYAASGHTLLWCCML